MLPRNSSGPGRAARKSCAIIPVHYGGQIGDLQAILGLGLPVIEDRRALLPGVLPAQRGVVAGRDGVGDCVLLVLLKTKPSDRRRWYGVHGETKHWRNGYGSCSLHGISHDAWKKVWRRRTWYYEIVAPGFKYNPDRYLLSHRLATDRKADRLHENVPVGDALCATAWRRGRTHLAASTTRSHPFMASVCGGDCGWSGSISTERNAC